MRRLLVLAALAACSGSSAPSIPDGWTGYVELFEGSGAPPSACSSGFTSLTSAGSAGLDAPLDCNCHCPAVADCPATPTPIAGALTTTWAATAFACEPTPASSCESSGSCKPSTPFFPGLCIYAPGDVPCPDLFSDRHVYYAGLSDTRTCCSCYYEQVQRMCVNVATPGGSATATNPFTYCCAP